LQRPKLTERDRTILQLIATGKSNKEISTELQMSESSIKREVGQILSILQARDRAHAASIAVHYGIAHPLR
jgi:DNA-binding NarL/FixJ family response regulator